MATAVKGKKLAISSGKAAVRGKKPVKRSINLAGYGEKPLNLKVAIPVIVIIVLAALALAKFGILDRYSAVSKAQAEVSAVQTQIDIGYKRLEDFAEVAERYAHYTYSGMTEEELERTDRIEVLQMIQRIVLPRASLESMQLKSNQLTLNVTGSTLELIRGIVQDLEAEELVNFCTVTTAGSEVTTSKDKTEENIVVKANIVVYLNNASEVENG